MPRLLTRIVALLLVASVGTDQIAASGFSDQTSQGRCSPAISAIPTLLAQAIPPAASVPTYHPDDYEPTVHARVNRNAKKAGDTYEPPDGASVWVRRRALNAAYPRKSKLFDSIPKKTDPAGSPGHEKTARRLAAAYIKTLELLRQLANKGPYENRLYASAAYQAELAHHPGQLDAAEAEILKILAEIRTWDPVLPEDEDTPSLSSGARNALGLDDVSRTEATHRVLDELILRPLTHSLTLALARDPNTFDLDEWDPAELRLLERAREIPNSMADVIFSVAKEIAGYPGHLEEACDLLTEAFSLYVRRSLWTDSAAEGGNALIHLPKSLIRIKNAKEWAPGRLPGELKEMVEENPVLMDIAFVLAEKLPHPHYRAEAILGLCEVVAQQGDPDRAVRMAETHSADVSIISRYTRSRWIERLAKQTAEVSSPNRIGTLRSLAQMASQISDDHEQGENNFWGTLPGKERWLALGSVAVALSKAGQNEQAHQMIASIAESVRQPLAVKHYGRWDVPPHLAQAWGNWLVAKLVRESGLTDSEFNCAQRLKDAMDGVIKAEREDHYPYLNSSFACDIIEEMAYRQDWPQIQREIHSVLSRMPKHNGTLFRVSDFSDGLELFALRALARQGQVVSFKTIRSIRDLQRIMIHGMYGERLMVDIAEALASHGHVREAVKLAAAIRNRTVLIQIAEMLHKKHVPGRVIAELLERTVIIPGLHPWESLVSIRELSKTDKLLATYPESAVTMLDIVEGVVHMIQHPSKVPQEDHSPLLKFAAAYAAASEILRLILCH